MSRRFYRGIRCRHEYPDGTFCNRLFMDWRDHWKHKRRRKHFG